MKLIKILLFTILLTISCKSTSKIASNTNKIITTKDSTYQKEFLIKIDTFFTQLADSAKSIIYINCDSLNNPQVNKSYITQGNNLKINYKFEDKIDNKQKNKNIPLYIDCKIDSNRIAFSYFNNHKEKFIFKSSDTSKTTIIQVPINKKLTKKEAFLMQLGKYTLWFFIIIITLLVGFGLAKLIKYMKWL